MVGRKRKSEGWLPADKYRIQAFTRSIVHESSSKLVGQKVKVSDVLSALDLCLEDFISEAEAYNWWNGKNKPDSKHVAAITEKHPACKAWLEPAINSSPMRRFLCALDVWGSAIESPTRKLLETTSNNTTVGNALAVLAKRWAPKPISTGGHDFSGYAIPLLKRRVPEQIPSTVYQASNPLTLMDFMFRSGAYLEFSDATFTEWAIDLASLTLFVRAFFDGTSLTNQMQSGVTGNYSSLVYRIFFRGHGAWPNVESIHGLFQAFTDFDETTSYAYSQRLMDAREVLSGQLIAIGSGLSVAEDMFAEIKDRNMMWHEPFGSNDDAFSPEELLQEKRNNAPAFPGRYRYELCTFNGGNRIVLCHDLETGTHAPLTGRQDLFHGYDGSFSWGYSGSGPTFLAISILAHHLGHSEFGYEEVNRLLERYISIFPEHIIETSFFLTTDLIDTCLNE